MKKENDDMVNLVESFTQALKLKHEHAAQRANLKIDIRDYLTGRRKNHLLVNDAKEIENNLANYESYISSSKKDTAISSLKNNLKWKTDAYGSEALEDYFNQLSKIWSGKDVGSSKSMRITITKILINILPPHLDVDKDVLEEDYSLLHFMS